MTLTADFVTGLLAVPVADLAATRTLVDYNTEQRTSRLEEWIRQLNACDDRLSIENLSRPDERWLVAELSAPYPGNIGFRFQDSLESLAGVSIATPQTIDVAVVLEVEACAVPPSAGTAASANIPEQTVRLSPEWTAAIVVEQAKPLYTGWSLGSRGAAPYFENDVTQSAAVSVTRARNSMRNLLTGVLTDKGSLAQRIEELEREATDDAPVFHCSTFLPSVFASPSAVKRFYSLYVGTAESEDLVDRKIAIHRDHWRAHIKRHQRIDIFDRGQFQEYLAAPEYYQMPLEAAELDEQLKVFEELLQEPNYDVCLTPEAVDLAYEIKGDAVSIRTDRRNKGQSRPGKVNGIVLSDPALVEAFRREFWTTYELTEPHFRDKAFISSWLRREAEPALKNGSYDLAFYGSRQRSEHVSGIISGIEDSGIRCWRAERDASLGIPWFEVLERLKVRAIAIVSDDAEVMPWVDQRMRQIVTRLSDKGVLVVVVDPRYGDHPMPGIEQLIVVSPDKAASVIPGILRGEIDFNQFRPLDSFDRDVRSFLPR